MKPSLTLLAKQIKLERIEKKLPVYDAGLGENPMPIPEILINETKKYSYLKNYTDAKGISKLKNILGNNLVVGNGLKPLLYLLQLAFSNLYKNGTIIHISPHWVSYKEQTNILNCKTFLIPTDFRDWKIDFYIFENILSKISGPKLLILNNPNNPSGCVYNKFEINIIANVCKKYDVIILSDDIYANIIHSKYEDDYINISEVYKNVINSSSLSKTFACGGYRLGWLKFPDNIDDTNLKDLYNYCHVLASSIYSCPTIMLQHVAAKALEYPEEIKFQIKMQKNMFQTISEFCKKRFNDMKIRSSDSKSSWYYLIDFSNYDYKLINKNIHNSNELNRRLIDDIGLITVSGTAFSIKKEYILRYSYVDIKDIDVKNNSFNFDNIKEGLDKLEHWLNSL